MTIEGRPDAEIDIEPPLVRALLETQHPDLAGLPLRDVGSGWDNRLYRLGEELAVRLPRRAVAAPLIEYEQRWLPELAPRLPLPIPLPMRVGRPGCGYPWTWSVVPWRAGESAETAPLGDPVAAAVDLGRFLGALHRPAPPAAPANPFRGVPLAARNDIVHTRVRDLDGLIDRARVLEVWERLVQAPPWNGTPLWSHGDLHPGNLLVREGRLSAVIDFGDLCAGDPATDLSVAWMLLPRSARPMLREAARNSDDAIDDATWTRARGWALALALAFLGRSRDNPIAARISRATIDAVLDDEAASRT
jgi:aminoglycoside phosphotransferase (APT) family kinase protein